MVRRRRKSRKWISWLVFLMLLIMAGVVCYFVWDNYFKEKDGTKQEGDSSVVTEENEDVEQKVEKRDDVGEGEVMEEEKKVVQYDGTDPNKNNDLTGVITYAGASGNNLMIRVNIDQYLSDGSCSLSLLSNGGVVYGDTAKIVASASTATCEGFDIPVSEVGSGNYEIVINLSSYDKTGAIKGEVNF